ncbi:MAG: tetratricopeptide repeat protein [Bacteroidales bacterium]|nr:tetratricopeptide repeat protein [Bacteroidales bacterium]
MKKIALLTFAALLMVSCGPSREDRINQIEDFEDSIFESAIAADPEVADQLTALYVAFADKYPNDSLSPEYLMKAAEVQGNVLHSDRAVELFDRVIADYPDFNEVPMCYFLKGNALELNSQIDEAKAAYEEFLEKYPDHYMAEQTRIMLPRIGMSPEEMLADILDHADDTIIATK